MGEGGDRGKMFSWERHSVASLPFVKCGCSSPSASLRVRMTSKGNGKYRDPSLRSG